MWRAAKVYRRVPGFRALKRAWRSRGFGIHSPFAFRFVRLVLRERGEYYAYSELRRMACDADGFHRLGLLFRLVCEFAPRRIILAGDAGVQERKAVRLADSRAAVADAPDAEIMPGTLLYVRGAVDEGLLSLAGDILAADGVAVFGGVSRGECPRFRSLLRHGMSFGNGDTLILVSRRDLPRQDFEINF